MSHCSRCLMRNGVQVVICFYCALLISEFALHQIVALIATLISFRLIIQKILFVEDVYVQNF